ncbi:hypothetical protein J4558_15720 [Leptolyngbya sp. 15MV]|nr:hypothetical protein J4558_15720 [Leptolyngbya sp. 15MV]
MPITRRILATAALGAALAIPAIATAQGFPTGTITMVIPFAPGGPTDVVGRLLAEVMGRDLGVSVIVENRGGAGGTIGVNRVVQARPDGQTHPIVSSSQAGPTRWPSESLRPRRSSPNQ